jgi:hypothetical protein
MMNDQIVEALAPLVSALEADGYGAHIDEQHGVVAFTITAGPDACEDCLSPRVIMEPTIINVLRRAGFDHTLKLTYPGKQ